MTNKQGHQPTHITYADPAGKQPFHAERTALHDQIIDTALRQGDNPRAPYREGSASPHALLVGGGFCARKTGIMRWMIERGTASGNEICISNNRLVNGAVIENRGRIFSSLPEFRALPEHPHPEKSPVLVAEYYHLRGRLVDAATQRQIPLIIEDHFDDKAQTQKLLQGLKDAGYAIGLVGGCISPHELFKSIGVDEKNLHYKIDLPWALQTHKDFATHFPEHAKHTDVAALYYIEGPDPTPVVKRSTPEKPLSIRHRDYYAQFQQWVNADVNAVRPEDVFTTPPKPPLSDKIQDILEQGPPSELPPDKRPPGGWAKGAGPKDG
jgi:hypothetical protein